MKKIILLSVLLSVSFITKAQVIEFEQVMPLPPAPQNIADFTGVNYSSVAFADIDGDGDQDVLITGYNSLYIPIAELYTNDGIGNYTLVSGTPFTGVYESSVAFADIDGDGDQDVLITGYTNSARISELYINDGLGNFTLVSGTPFTGVYQSSIAFADIDGDGDQDVLITGQSSLARIANLYTNDGMGNFTLAPGTPFTGVIYSSIAFVDIDGDNDQDILIAGGTNTGPISKLYKNDGLGSFTLVSGTPFTGISHGSIAFVDTDGDSDKDVLITGYNSLNIPIAELYINDGLGSFTLVSGTPFTGVNNSSVAFADIDGDGDQDVLITGYNSSYTPISKLYTNDGTGNYTLSGSLFSGVANSSIAFKDIDGDNDQDILITGKRVSEVISELYTNDGTGSFTLVSGTPFAEVEYSSVDFADIDGDSDQDVLITGQNSLGNPISSLYTNDGFGNYTQVTGTPFIEVAHSSIAFKDIDGDNDQDILITGKISTGSITNLYRNDGLGSFTLVSGTLFTGISDGSIAFADIDGDGDQDVLITGYNSSYIPISELYTNDGTGNYTLSGSPFSGVTHSSIAFADIDGDGDQDVLITGQNGSGNPISEFYTNDGLGNYTLVSGTPLSGVAFSSIAFADIDGDGDQDVLITGQNDSSNPISELYTNGGIGNFTLVSGTPFPGVSYSSIAFADMDGDGDQDVLITGRNSSGIPISELYTNDGSGNFTLISGTPFSGIYFSSIAFADIDGDSDQDVVITGRDNSGNIISRLYRNITCNPNTDVIQNGVTLTSNATGATYQWLDCNDNYSVISGETSQTFVATVNGSYAVKVTQNSCTDTSACFTISNVSIQSLAQSTYNLYPNPVNDELTIESQGKISLIEVYSATGQLLKSINPSSKVIKIDFSTYQQGIYLVKVHTTEGQIATSRIVKSK